MPSTNGHGPTRAILYARVSTDEQARSGYSLAQQLEALRRHATQEGYEVLEEVTDPGQSGASLERPGMDRVRDLVAAGGVSFVLAQDRDRFTREPAYHYLLRKEFEEHGCKIHALNDRGDESQEGELTDGILDQLAKYERAKIAERSRRGMLRKAQEGKVIVARLPNYGFEVNEARDSYVVDETKMLLVRRIFRMIGLETYSINRVVSTLAAESIPSPTGKPKWSRTLIRNIIKDDVYKPHTCEEIKELVAPEVAAHLDPDRCYGVWWFNRRRVVRKQVARAGTNGKTYRKLAKLSHRPPEDWIAVPVPDAGVSRELVEAARRVIENNAKPSAAGARFWELSGGILHCGVCSLRMRIRAAWSGKGGKPRYYYTCGKANADKSACHHRKNHRAADLETTVWQFVSGLLKDPEQLRADLERMVELEREGMHGDPDRESKVWLDKISEVNRKRSGFQDMAADGLITFDELRAKLAALEETRETAERELAALKGRKERMEALERDKDVVLEHYAALAPEALDHLTPEERHHLYKMLRLKAFVYPEGTLEVDGELGGDLGGCSTETIETRSFKSPPRAPISTWTATSRARIQKPSRARLTTVWVSR
jgi:site-specific DNA recombinase